MSIDATGNNPMAALQNMAAQGEAQATSAQGQVSSDIASGNTNAVSQDMNNFEMGQLQSQTAAAMESDLIKGMKDIVQDFKGSAV